MIPMGLSLAITIRVGQAKGRDKCIEARYIGYAGILLCIIVMAVSASIFVTVPEMIVGLYTEDLQVQTLAIQLLYMAAIFQLSDGMQVGALGALRGLKDTKIPLVANLAAYWGLGLPLAYLVGIHFNVGPEGMWVGLITGLITAAIFHSWRFRILTTRLLILPFHKNLHEKGRILRMKSDLYNLFYFIKRQNSIYSMFGILIAGNMIQNF